MRLIIFDFDGTLVDSRKLIWESHRIVFGDFGFPCPSREESLALIGMSLEKVLAQLAGPDAPVTEMTATYQRLLPRLREQPEFADAPFDGAAELLAMLAVRADTRLSIATGHVAQTIEPVLKTLGWREYFCNLQSADRAPSKPNPGMLLQALSETGTRAENAVMIGDTVFDIEMACAAGGRWCRLGLPRPRAIALRRRLACRWRHGRVKGSSARRRAVKPCEIGLETIFTAL